MILVPHTRRCYLYGGYQLGTILSSNIGARLLIRMLCVPLRDHIVRPSPVHNSSICAPCTLQLLFFKFTHSDSSYFPLFFSSSYLPFFRLLPTARRRSYRVFIICYGRARTSCAVSVRTQLSTRALTWSKRHYLDE